MANLHLVTGHAGEPHVKSTDDASLMQAIYGGNSVVLDRNNAFAYYVISNNIVRVYDGEALMQGRYIKMDKGNYVDLNIDNGHTGYRRIDVIAIEYSKNDETNIEEANLVVVKGSETQQEEATVPELVDGDTVDGSASTNQMALYHVKIDGLSITDVEQAFTLGQDFQLASGQINTIGAIAHRLVNVAKKGLDVFKQLSYDDEADVQTRTDYESLVNGLDDAGSYVFPPTQNGDGGVTPDANAINRLNTRLTSAIENERKDRELADENNMLEVDQFIRNEFEMRDERSNVVNVFPTSSDAENYINDVNKNDINKNDIYVILNDSNHNGDKTYYRYDGDKYNLIAFESANHTNAEIDTLLNAKQDKLSESQLATVNSGLTSSDKAKLDGLDSRVTTNTNDIATLNAQVNELKGAGGGIDGIGAGFHSSIYRGKYLGDTYTDAQKEAIANGSFDDLFIGDYWTINDVNWRIADFDYYYRVGNTSFNKHHVIIVPDSILYEARISDTNNVCYSGSRMYTNGLNSARNTFNNAFGSSYIPTHRGLYSNTMSNGVPSDYAWRDMKVELMNEEQVLGHAVWGQNGYDVGTQKTQFRLFALDKTKINIRNRYWLTNVKSLTEFSYIDTEGNASYNISSNSYGVRPFACLVGDSE